MTLINFSFPVRSSHGDGNNTVSSVSPLGDAVPHGRPHLGSSPNAMTSPHPPPHQVPVLAPDPTPTNYTFTVISASAFTLVACLALLYSLLLYLYRVDGIRQRLASARYHDSYGPTVLCAAMFMSVVINYALRFRMGDVDSQDVHTDLGPGKTGTERAREVTWEL